jgi:hypothetical protein
MDVIERTLTRVLLYSEAKITVLREWSNKTHKEGINAVNDRPDSDLQRSDRVRACRGRANVAREHTQNLLCLWRLNFSGWRKP